MNTCFNPKLPTAPQFWWIWLLNKQRLHIQASLSHSIVGHLPWFLRRPPGAFHQTPLLPIPNCVFTAAETQPCLGFPTWKNDCTFNSPSSKSLIGHLPQFLGCQLFRSSGGLPRVISFHHMARTPDVRLPSIDPTSRISGPLSPRIVELYLHAPPVCRQAPGCSPDTLLLRLWTIQS